VRHDLPALQERSVDVEGAIGRGGWARGNGKDQDVEACKRIQPSPARLTDPSTHLRLGKRIWRRDGGERRADEAATAIDTVTERKSLIC